MNRADGHAALGDHPARHRAVDAAGKKQRGPAAGAHGHAAHRHDGVRIQIGIVADLHRQRHVGMLHIHLQVGTAFQNIAAHFHVDGHGIHGIALVAAAGVDLEGAVMVFQHLQALGADRFEIVLIHFHGPAHAVYAEYLRHPADGLVHVRHIADVDPAVVEPDMALNVLHRVPDALHQHPHEIGAVLAFQMNFAEANLQ